MDALCAGGTEVIWAERAGDHGGPFWREEFPLMVAWAFPVAGSGPSTEDRGG